MQPYSSNSSDYLVNRERQGRSELLAVTSTFDLLWYAVGKERGERGEGGGGGGGGGGVEGMEEGLGLGMEERQGGERLAVEKLGAMERKGFNVAMAELECGVYIRTYVCVCVHCVCACVYPIYVCAHEEAIAYVCAFAEYIHVRINLKHTRYVLCAYE